MECPAMSLLRAEPPEPVRTLEEFFAIAEALEEAATRYAGLAAQMRASALPELADTFERLAAEERGHADQVARWSHARTGAAPNPAWIRWQAPATFDEEEARGIASSSFASAYRALSMAVRNEERAFALWTYIAAQAVDPAIWDAAERMATEELGHAALLRRERRRTFHAERRSEDGMARASRRRPIADAVWAERTLAALLNSLAGQPGAPAELRRLASETADLTLEAAAVAPADAVRASPQACAMAQATSGADALRLSERAVEAYLDAADRSSDEAMLRQLQSLASRAIARSAALQRLVGEG